MVPNSIIINKNNNKYLSGFYCVILFKLYNNPTQRYYSQFISEEI